VEKNLSRIRAAMGAEEMIHMHQCHGIRMRVLRDEAPESLQHPPRADALITDIAGLALMVKQADCQAVILYDPERGVAANVHCGWRGNVMNIPGRVVARMKHDFGCEPSRMLAAVGPSLGPCCAEFLTHEEIFPKSFERFRVRENHFDLWALSVGQLLEAGLREAQIEVARICSRCRTDLFFSYRAEGVTGRFATVLMLR
jgi:YfiH family protein